MFNRILVTLDGSEFSEAVLPYARQLSQGSVAHITLLRVADLPSVAGEVPVDAAAEMATRGGGAATQVRETIDQRMSRAEDEALTYLNHNANILRAAGAAVDTEVLFSDKVAESIVEYAKGADADVIVMATHGRTGLAGMLMGSVASDVVRTSHRPVMLLCPGGDIGEA